MELTSEKKDNYSCCDSSLFPTNSFSFLAEYKLDAEGFFSMDMAKPYKRHVHIVEGLVEDGNSKIVHVSDIVSSKWMMGMWRNTRTRLEFINGVCVNEKMDYYVTNNSGKVIQNIPKIVITEDVGKTWSEESMYLTSRALEVINRLNPTNKKTSELPISVLRRSNSESESDVFSVYPVTPPHPPSVLLVKNIKDQDKNKYKGVEWTIVRGAVYKKNAAHEEWLRNGSIAGENNSLKSVEMKDKQEEFWRCFCCCCV